MFKSSGYFKGLTCPYFANGLCEKPYCHFRHIKSDDSTENKNKPDLSVPIRTPTPENVSVKASSSAGEGGVTRKPSLLSMVGSAIKQVQRDIERDRAKLDAFHNSKSRPAPPPWYNPTPIQRTPAQKAPSETDGSKDGGATAAKKRKVPGAAAPAYNPTPIHLLKHPKEAQGNLEYDPLRNFSTRASTAQKLTAGQRVTLGAAKGQASLGKRQNDTEADSALKKARVDRSVSVDSIEAKFSDEDDDAESANSVADSREDEAKQTPLEEKDQAARDKTKKDTGGNKTDNNAGKISEDDSSVSIKSKEVLSHVDHSETAGKCGDDPKLADASIKKKPTEEMKTVQESSMREKETTGTDKKLSDEANVSSQKGTVKSVENIDGGNKSLESLKDLPQRQSSSSSSHRHKIRHHSCGHSVGGSNESRSRHSSSKSDHSHEQHGSRSSNKSNHQHRKRSSSKSPSKVHHHSSSRDHHSNTRGKKSPHLKSSKHSKPSSPNKDNHSNAAHSKESSSSRIDKSHSSKHHHSMSKGKEDVPPSTSAKKHKRSNLFETFQRSVSHKDLFGDDSDSDKNRLASTKTISMEKDKHAKVKAEKTNITTTNGVNYESDDLILLSSDSDENNDDWNVVADSSEMHQELSKEDRYEECLKNEPPRKRLKNDSGQREPTCKISLSSDDEASPLNIGKKRKAHAGANDGCAQKQAKPKSVSRLTPSQVMLQRYHQLQKQAQEAKEATDKDSRTSTFNTSAPSSGTSAAAAATAATAAAVATGRETSRTAHVSKPLDSKVGSSLLKKRRPSLPSAGGSKPEVTRCGTVAKLAKREAHVPAETILKRPTIPTSVGGKVATNIRQRYLNQFIDDALKIYPAVQDAFDRAVAEEKAVYERCPNRNIYLNLAINTIKKLRDEASGGSPQKATGTPSKNPKAMSHASILGGAKATTTSYTVHRSGGPLKQPDAFAGVELYDLLEDYILTDQLLVDNYFPRPNSDLAGQAVLKIPDYRKKAKCLKVNEHCCVRCGGVFVVFPNGTYAKDDTCCYHWGKAWKRRIAGSLETRYTCCQSDMSAKGCQLADHHVHEDNKYENVSGYVRTFPSSPPSDGNYGVYSLDCEMIYTCMGSELARITVVGPDLKTFYEKLVLPDHKVLDYNTRFSGITKEDMKGVTTTLTDVQEVLLGLFTSKTILIGHSLESDFIALKLIHDTVVDTSVVFPHRMGPPLKRALRTLMAEILQKIIQNDVGGHDSQEDASACMELMMWKLKQDNMKNNRRLLGPKS